MRVARRLTVMAAVASLAIGLAYAQAGPHLVDQLKLQFSEPSLTIKKGEKVRFTNSDRTAHNIMVEGGGMAHDSGLQQPGEPTEVPFTKAGTYKISCAIHPKMTMTVTVRD